MFSRNGECPVAVVAAATPSDCFNMAVEAARLAIKYMTPVILLTDGYIGNGSEPWRVTTIEELPEFKANFRTDPQDFHPYVRDEKLVRPWVKPGTPGMEHRIGGLEKQHIYGNISYDPDNHEFMVKTREQKIQNIANDIPELEVIGDKEAELLVMSWGSTFGAVASAVENQVAKGNKVAFAHFKYINPMPKNTEAVIKSYKKILVPEVNMGQLSKILRMNYVIEPIQFNKIKGTPFKAYEIEQKIEEILKGSAR